MSEVFEWYLDEMQTIANHENVKKVCEPYSANHRTLTKSEVLRALFSKHLLDDILSDTLLSDEEITSNDSKTDDSGDNKENEQT